MRNRRKIPDYRIEKEKLEDIRGKAELITALRSQLLLNICKTKSHELLKHYIHNWLLERYNHACSLRKADKECLIPQRAFQGSHHTLHNPWLLYITVHELEQDSGSQNKQGLPVNITMFDISERHSSNMETSALRFFTISKAFHHHSPLLHLCLERILMR